MLCNSDCALSLLLFSLGTVHRNNYFSDVQENIQASNYGFCGGAGGMHEG